MLKSPNIQNTNLSNIFRTTELIDKLVQSIGWQSIAKLLNLLHQLFFHGAGAFYRVFRRGNCTDRSIILIFETFAGDYSVDFVLLCDFFDGFLFLRRLLGTAPHYVCVKKLNRY